MDKERLEELQEEIELLQGYKHMYGKLSEENIRLREALKFYADKDNYEFETIVSDCDIEVKSKILEDGGEKARQALKE